MSRLQLLILWALAIGAGILYFNSRSAPENTNSKTDLTLGDPLVPGNLVETIDGFKLKVDDKAVTVKRTENRWYVVEKDNYPALESSIVRVLDALREAKVAQAVAASKEYYDRFELDVDAESDEKGPNTITLMKEGTDPVTIYFGKNRESTGGRNKLDGRFVRISNDESGVYVTKESFGFLGADPDYWIDQNLIPLKEGAIKLEVTAPNDETFKSWVVSRKTVRDDFLLEGLGAEEETKTNETAILKNVFAGATFSELVSEEDYKKRANEKATRQLKATDSTGTTFLITITPEKEKEAKEEKKNDPAAPTSPPAINYLVSIKILNGPTKPEALAEDASLQEKAVYAERVNNLADVSKSVNRMRETYEGRYFLVSSSTVGPLTKNRGELIQPKKKEKKPVSVATPPIKVPTPGSGGATSLPGVKKPPPMIARPKEDKKKPKIEAVTPPIRVPEIPKKPEPKDELGIGDAPEPVEDSKPEAPKEQE